MRYYRALVEMAANLYDEKQMQSINRLVAGESLNFSRLKKFDCELGGPGIHNINDGDTGRYEVADRAILRPIQYVEVYFQMKPELGGWVTRAVVMMSGAHLEALLKRLLGNDNARLPMGACLRHPRVKETLDRKLLCLLLAFTLIHNDAKHAMNHEKDTHRFAWQEAVLAYVVARKLGAALMQKVELATPASAWA